MEICIHRQRSCQSFWKQKAGVTTTKNWLNRIMNGMPMSSTSRGGIPLREALDTAPTVMK